MRSSITLRFENLAMGAEIRSMAKGWGYCSKEAYLLKCYRYFCFLDFFDLKFGFCNICQIGTIVL